MIKKYSALILLLACFAPPFASRAQNAASLGTINWNGMTLPAIVGTPITVNGQTLIINTNSSGGYTIMTYGPNGTNSFTPPTTISGAEAFAESAINANNPANIGFYPTNGEWNFSVAGVFAQNSGQAAAQISLEHYFNQNLGLGVAVLEGNQNGMNGTAAAYAYGSYRKPIGDTALIASLGGGYDNYTGKPMGIVKIEVEHRSSAHLGEFVGVAYDFEGLGQTKTAAKTTIQDPSGIIVGGGIRYSFSSLNLFSK